MFQELFTMLIDKQMLTISLLRKEDKFVVSVLPQSPNVTDGAKTHIIPLNLSGTPAELDEGFISAISTPIKKASGILMNMEEYEQKTEKAASESKALKEKTEKISKAIKDAEALETEKPREALLTYKKILEQDKHNSKVIGKIKALEKKMSEGSLFGEEEIITIVGNENVPPPVSAGNGVTVVKDVAEQPATSPQALSLTSEHVDEPKITKEPPVDMFAGVVTQSQQEKQQIEVTPNNAVNNPVDPESYNQFLQFMAMQKNFQQAE